MVLSVVEPEGELVEIHGQVLFADVLVGAHHATLQERPEILAAIGMHFTAHVFAFAVLDDLMREKFAKLAVSRMLVCRQQAYVGRYGLMNETVQRLATGILDHLADDVSFARDSADYSGFTGRLAP